MSTPREHLAWLIYCVDHGYTAADDRAILTNWLLQDPSTLHPDDAELRPHLLAMADEVLEAMVGEWECGDCGSDYLLPKAVIDPPVSDGDR